MSEKPKMIGIFRLCCLNIKTS